MAIVKNCETCGKKFSSYPSQRRIFCSQRCGYSAKVRPLAERFWEKVDRGPGCWIWKGAKTKKGYGKIYEMTIGEHKVLLMAHRVSWELHRGLIPDGLWVLHNCPSGDNPLCVNPEHLFLGTSDDNIADMIRKGRNQKGETSGHSRLRDCDVIDIRARRANGESVRDIACRYRLSENHVYSICARTSWRHVE